MEHVGTCWKILEHVGTRWNTLEHVGSYVERNDGELEDVGRSWNMLDAGKFDSFEKSSGAVQHVVAFVLPQLVNDYPLAWRRCVLFRRQFC